MLSQVEYAHLPTEEDTVSTDADKAAVAVNRDADLKTSDGSLEVNNLNLWYGCLRTCALCRTGRRETACVKDTPPLTLIVLCSSVCFFFGVCYRYGEGLPNVLNGLTFSVKVWQLVVS